jgi:diketogulonate reductase-like aldo/keto reductase
MILHYNSRHAFLLAAVMILGHCMLISSIHSLVVDKNTRHHHHQQQQQQHNYYCQESMNRRDALIRTVGTAAATGASLAAPLVVLPSRSAAATEETASVDMDVINAARNNKPRLVTTVSDTPEDMEKINLARSSSSSRMAVSSNSSSSSSMSDPPPLLSIPRGAGGVDGRQSRTIKIPRIGYSFYKTPVDQTARCAALALLAGVRHFDVATDYESNAEIGKALQVYLNAGMAGMIRNNNADLLLLQDEKPELIDQFEVIARNGEMHANALLTSSSSSSSSSISISPPPQGVTGRRGRREGLFIHHKISNTEQRSSENNDDDGAVFLRRAVKNAIATLGCSYLDMVSIHSPLTDKARRLGSYKVLLDLRDSGFVKSVGVCNYGVAALQEILDANDDLDLPVVNQLELSPFSQHHDIVDWCNKHGVAVSCSAWSKLSSADGPTEQWDILSKIAQRKQMTKAQVMVRWALQKGYICVPRSSSASKVERLAIAENSYGGVNSGGGGAGNSPFILTQEDMSILDSFPAGKLGRRDGWTDSDVTGPSWDPTNFV